MSGQDSAENDVAPKWFEGGDGHGYRYQYIGPVHYLCECGDYFLNRDRWIAHKAAPLIRRAINDPGAFVKRGPDYDGEPYGERLDRWQDRAIKAALDRLIPPNAGPLSGLRDVAPEDEADEWGLRR